VIESRDLVSVSRLCIRGGARHFPLGGTGGPSFATRGAVNRLFRTFRKTPGKFWGGTGGGRQNFGGQWAPLTPP